MKRSACWAIFILIVVITLPTAGCVAPVHAQDGKIVPYVPTPQEVVDRMLELAEVKKGDVVYDLGSVRWSDRGDGGQKIRRQGGRF